MASRIRKLHWGRVLPKELLPGSALFDETIAIWPAPVNADACFDAAGFHDFDDGGDEWDADWMGIVGRVVRRLEKCGQPTVRSEAEVYELDAASCSRRLLAWFIPKFAPLKKANLSVIEQLIVVTEDDRFGAVWVEFGSPPNASLYADSGHSILWVGLSNACGPPEAIVADVANGLATVETRLKWDLLR